MTAIVGRGTPESHWLPWLAGADLPVVSPPRPRTSPGRVLVVAAHPDDEVLGAGGLLHHLARDGWQVDAVWASDGEASHPGSPTLDPAELARLRRQESQAARAVLGLTGSLTWLGLPDSHVSAHEATLTAAVDGHVRDADLVLAPWREDGHPDHDACGRAAATAADRYRVPLWELPIWAWHWGRPEDLAGRWPHAQAVPLSPDEQATKATAVSVFTTQTLPLGPAPQDAPVLAPWVLDRFARSVEVVLVTEPADPRPGSVTAPATAAGGRP